MSSMIGDYVCMTTGYSMWKYTCLFLEHVRTCIKYTRIEKWPRRKINQLKNRLTYP